MLSNLLFALLVITALCASADEQYTLIVPSTGTSNSQRGITFNVEALSADIKVTNLTTGMDVTSGVADVEVWITAAITSSKPSAVGTSAWTKVHDASSVAVSGGVLPVKLDSPFVVSAGQTVGVAILCSVNVRYYTDTAGGVLATTGSSIKVHTGGFVGWGVDAAGTLSYNPREFAGSVTYLVKSGTAGTWAPIRQPTPQPSLTTSPSTAPTLHPSAHPTVMPTPLPTASLSGSTMRTLRVQASGSSNSQAGITFNVRADASLVISELSTEMTVSTGSQTVAVWTAAEIGTPAPPAVGSPHWTRVHYQSAAPIVSSELSVVLQTPIYISAGTTVGIAIVCGSTNVRYYTDPDPHTMATTGAGITVFTGGAAGWGLGSSGALNNNPREFQGSIGYSAAVTNSTVTPPTVQPSLQPSLARQPTSGPTRAFTAATWPYNAGRLTGTNSAQSNYAEGCLQRCSGDSMSFSTCNAQSSGDTYLRLYNAADTQLTYNDDHTCSYGGTKSYIEYTVTQPGCHWFCLRMGCYGSGSCTVYAVLDGATAAPTLSPTAPPPTFRPTARPTVQPTFRPTFRPTVPVGSEVLAFAAKLQLGGIDAADVNNQPGLQRAAVVAAAESMGIDAAYVTFQSATTVYARLLAASNERTPRGERELTVAVCEISTDVDVPVERVGSSSASTAYTTLTNALSAAATSGALLTKLQEAANSTGTSGFVASASVNGVQNGAPSTYSTTGTPTGAPTEKYVEPTFWNWLAGLPMAVKAGGGAAICLVLVIAGCCLQSYYLRRQFERMMQEESVEVGEFEMRAGEAGAGPAPSAPDMAVHQAMVHVHTADADADEMAKLGARSDQYMYSSDPPDYNYGGGAGGYAVSGGAYYGAGTLPIASAVVESSVPAPSYEYRYGQTDTDAYESKDADEAAHQTEPLPPPYYSSL